MKLLTFLAFCLVYSFSHAQEYRLSGTYLIDKPSKAPVEFSLRWKQQEGQLQGEYSDDRYTEKTKAVGTITTGNNFSITLPTPNKGVKSITVLGPRLEKSDTGRTVPLTVVTRDIKGNPITTAEVNASFIALTEAQLTQAQEAGPDCVANFGELSNICGIYAGMISEESDPTRSCDLTNAPALRLEIDYLGEVRLHTNEVSEIVATPVHELGRLPANPSSTSIDILNRECRALPQAAFAPDNCKRLNLTGTFSRDEDAWHFVGSYLITDEKTNRSCRYRFSLDQQGAAEG